MKQSRKILTAWAVVLGLLVSLTASSQNQRNRAAGQPADPPETNLEALERGDTPQNLGASGEPININFNDVELADFVASMATQLGINVELPPAGFQTQGPGGNITIVSTHSIPAELAMELLESVLRSRNHALIPTLEGNLYKIENQLQTGVQGGAGNDKTPLIIGNSSDVGGFDRVSTHVLQPQYANVDEITDLLGTVASGKANIVAYANTNMLIITDTADGIRNIKRLLNAVDLPGYNTIVELFTLEYSRAETIVTQIEQVLQGDDGTVSGQRGNPITQRNVAQAQRRGSPSVPGQPTTGTVGSAEEVLRMVPDERLNAVIVVATPSLMEEVRFLVQQIDTPTPIEGGGMHYVPLRNADAEAVAEVLETLTSTSPRQGNEQGGPSSEVQPFEKSVIVSVYEPTNALLILASAQDFTLLKTMIDQVDVPPRQVNIEAMIMQVTLTDGVELTVDTASIAGDDVFALSNSTNIANAIANGPLSLASPGGVFGILDGMVSVPDGTGGSVSVPNVPLLIRAIEQLTDLEVLSKPNLMTVDNEEAEINVGDEVPIISSQGDTDDRTGFNSRSRVERRDTGVTLRVTPSINEGDNVRMEINVEVSAVAESSVGIDPNETGATIAQSIISNTVVIGDGQTGIIGGLIQASRSEATAQVPILGDIPIIGLLFRGNAKNRRKQNLVVLVTPHIVKEAGDLDQETEYRLQEYYNERMDAIFSKDGFIKKIRRKHEQRKARPNDPYDPNRPGGAKAGFQRVKTNNN